MLILRFEVRVLLLFIVFNIIISILFNMRYFIEGK